MLKIFKYDERPKFQFTVRDENDVVFNLTGVSSAKCYIRKSDAAANKFSGGAENAVVISAPDGRIDYQLPAGGIDEEGVYSAQVILIYAANEEQQCERFQFKVEAGLRPSTP